MRPARTAVPGRPTGGARWRRSVAARAAPSPTPPDGVSLRFALPPGAWVDIDTLVESTLGGLRDAGTLSPRLAGLDAIVATRHEHPHPGAELTFPSAAALRRRRLPGPVLLDVAWDRVPRPGNRDHKRGWRARIAAQWDARPVLTGEVWAEISLGVRGSLLGPLEVAVDALEPVLGRDPRGRSWQEFFPNDHHIAWLRVQRTPALPGVRLRLGPLSS